MRPMAEDIVEHEYFSEAPRPKATALFPTFPSKAGGERRRGWESPSAPRGGEAPKIISLEEGGIFSGSDKEEVGAGFALKLV
jgi:cell division cycle 2-like protein